MSNIFTMPKPKIIIGTSVTTIEETAKQIANLVGRPKAKQITSATIEKQTLPIIDLTGSERIKTTRQNYDDPDTVSFENMKNALAAMSRSGEEKEKPLLKLMAYLILV